MLGVHTHSLIDPTRFQPVDSSIVSHVTGSPVRRILLSAGNLIQNPTPFTRGSVEQYPPWGLKTNAPEIDVGKTESHMHEVSRSGSETKFHPALTVTNRDAGNPPVVVRRIVPSSPTAVPVLGSVRETPRSRQDFPHHSQILVKIPTDCPSRAGVRERNVLELPSNKLLCPCFASIGSPDDPAISYYRSCGGISKR
jgi:hypothetical protein